MKLTDAITKHNLFKTDNSFLDDVENISNRINFVKLLIIIIPCLQL